MKREAEYFAGRDPSLIYVARRLKDATRLEGLLDEAGLDYGVEPDYYTAGIIFRTARLGAFFYVLPEVRVGAIELLLSNGYVAIEPEPGE